MLTFATVSSLVLLIGLCFWVMSLRSVVVRLAEEVRGYGRSEAQARQASIEAQAALIVALETLRGELKPKRGAQSAAEVPAKPVEDRGSASEPPPAADASVEGDRTTLEISRPPPGCDPEASGADDPGEGDPTTILSREATAAAILGIPYKRLHRDEDREGESLGPDDATPEAGIPVPAIPPGPNGSRGSGGKDPPGTAKDRPKKK